MSAVNEYIALTDQIRELTERRKAIGATLPHGRSEGLGKDVRVCTSHVTNLDLSMLRRYVTQDVIRMCSTTSTRRQVAVVAKLKPKKEKQHG